MTRDLTRERERVLQVLYQDLEIRTNQELDDLAREILELPERPPGKPPFVGWLLPEEKEEERIGKTSVTGINFIKRWEGFRSQAYRCPAGIWTIGYGHTKTARRGWLIDEAEAEILLQQDLKTFEDSVNSLVTVKLNQNQFDALVSFTFNVGAGAFAQSTLLRLLNQGKFTGAAQQFDRWVHAGRRVLPGLVARREAERLLFEAT